MAEDDDVVSDVSADADVKYKTFAAPVEKQIADRKFTFTFSSAAVDRDKDVIDQSGIDLANYKKNPVVLWAHSYGTPPIGRVTSTWFRKGSFMGTIEFPPKGTYPLADSVHDLIDTGFIKATSIGFRPKEWAFNEDRGGIDFKEVELLEISIVPVGSNMDALREAKGIDLEPFRKWAEMVTQSKSTAGDQHKDVDVAKQVANALDDAAADADDVKIPGSEATDLRKLIEEQSELIKTQAAVIKKLTESETKAVPSSVSEKIAPNDTVWSAPSLQDFTDKSWGDLSDAEKRRIAGYYAWSRTMPPETFGDLKLPHHRPSDGYVVPNAVRNALARLDQVQGLGNEKGRVRAHLNGHMEKIRAREERSVSSSPKNIVYRKPNNFERALLKRSIKALLVPVLKEAAAEQVRYHTGRLDD